MSVGRRNAGVNQVRYWIPSAGGEGKRHSAALAINPCFGA